MLNNLGLALTFLMTAATGHSATISAIKSLTDTKIEDVAALAEAESTSGLNVEKWEYSYTTENRNIIGVIKQAIYISLSDDAFSKPDEVSVTAIRKNDLSLVDAVRTAIGLSSSPQESRESLANDLVESLDTVRKSTRELRLFAVKDGNSFGLCNRVAVVDIINKEILFIGSCYSE